MYIRGKGIILDEKDPAFSIYHKNCCPSGSLFKIPLKGFSRPNLSSPDQIKALLSMKFRDDYDPFCIVSAILYRCSLFPTLEKMESEHAASWFSSEEKEVHELLLKRKWVKMKDNLLHINSLYVRVFTEPYVSFIGRGIHEFPKWCIFLSVDNHLKRVNTKIPFEVYSKIPLLLNLFKDPFDYTSIAANSYILKIKVENIQEITLNHLITHKITN